jgi:hypothetical protein
MKTAITVAFSIMALAACKNDDRSMQPPPIDPTIPAIDTSQWERRCERRLGNRDEPAFSECVVELSEAGMIRAAQ